MASAYEQGEKFTSATQLFDHISRGGFIFFGGKVVNPGWAMSWQLSMLPRIIGWGSYYAYRKPTAEPVKRSPKFLRSSLVAK